MHNSVDSLFEKWFHCEDLGTQLVPVIKEYFASEQHRTGLPIPGTIPENPPYRPNSNIKVENPFNLDDWLVQSKAEIRQNGAKKLFDNPCYKSEVVIYGASRMSVGQVRSEIWLWQVVREIIRVPLYMDIIVTYADFEIHSVASRHCFSIIMKFFSKKMTPS